MKTGLLAVGAASLLWASPASAQRLRPAPSLLFSRRAELSGVPDTLPAVGDHRVSGAVIGGLLGGAIGYAVGRGVFGSSGGGSACAGCESGDESATTTLVWTIGGAAIGAGLGYLMGRSTPKKGSMLVPEH